MPVTLWKANFKVNTDERGFDFGFHVVNNDVAAVRTIVNDIAARYKLLMPKSAEIFYASISKWDSPRDGRFMHLAVGPGAYVEDEGPPEKSDYDFSRTCVNIRLETDTGLMATHKFTPIPDAIVYGGAVTTAITPVIGTPVGALPDPGDGANWFEEFTNFMKALVKNCAHVKSPIPPGLDYVATAYVNGFAARVSEKKGGRVSI